MLDAALNEPECECSGPGFCRRYSKTQTAYAHSVCTGRGLPGFPVSADKSERYRRAWRERAGRDPAPAPTISLAAFAPPPGGPGTELKKLLAGLGLTAGGCNCNSRAAQMDRWGVEGCRANRAEIVAWLESERAKRGWWATVKAGVVAVVSGGFIPSPLDPLNSLLNEAIRRAECV